MKHVAWKKKSNWIQTSDPLVTDPDALTLSYKRLMGAQSIKLDSCGRQVLTEPSGPWCPTFAFFYTNSCAGHPRFYSFRALGAIQFSLEHSLDVKNILHTARIS